MRNNFLERLEFLEKQALDDGIIVNRESEFSMFYFLDVNGVEKYPFLFLTDVGLFRIVWKDNLSRLSLMFFNNDLVQYTIIRKNLDKNGNSFYDSIAGKADFEEVLRIINNYNLNFLLWDKNES